MGQRSLLKDPTRPEGNTPEPQTCGQPCSTPRNPDLVLLPMSRLSGPMPEAGLESWLQGWGLAQRKQEEATPISMHYTAFLQNEYKTLVLFFCVRERRGGREVTRKQYSAGTGAPAVTMAVVGVGRAHQLVRGAVVQGSRLKTVSTDRICQGVSKGSLRSWGKRASYFPWGRRQRGENQRIPQMTPFVGDNFILSAGIFLRINVDNDIWLTHFLATKGASSWTVLLSFTGLMGTHYPALCPSMALWLFFCPS